MKVIGKVNDKILIVEIHEDELANIRGVSSMYSLERESNKKLGVGFVLKVDKIFQDAREAIEQYSELKGSIKAINASTKKLLDKVAILEGPKE